MAQPQLGDVRGADGRRGSAVDPRAGRGTSSALAPRRIRHEARDGLTAAGVSLAASVLLTLAVAGLVRWLG